MLKETQRRITKRASMIVSLENKVEGYARHIINLELFVSNAEKEAVRNAQAKIQLFKRLIANYNEQILIESEYLSRLNAEFKHLGGE